jgi:hypothetical protein
MARPCKVIVKREGLPLPASRRGLGWFGGGTAEQWRAAFNDLAAELEAAKSKPREPLSPALARVAAIAERRRYRRRY